MEVNDHIFGAITHHNKKTALSFLCKTGEVRYCACLSKVGIHVYLNSIANQSGNPRVSALPLDQVWVFQRAKDVKYTYTVFRGISPSMNARVNGENVNLVLFLAHEEKFSKSTISAAEVAENAEYRFIG